MSMEDEARRAAAEAGGPSFGGHGHAGFSDGEAMANQARWNRFGQSIKRRMTVKPNNENQRPAADDDEDDE